MSFLFIFSFLTTSGLSPKDSPNWLHPEAYGPVVMCLWRVINSATKALLTPQDNVLRTYINPLHVRVGLCKKVFPNMRIADIEYTHLCGTGTSSRDSHGMYCKVCTRFPHFTLYRVGGYSYRALPGLEWDLIFKDINI